MKQLVILGALLFSQDLLGAGVEVAVCHGCSNRAMSQEALRSTGSGTFYVFNQTNSKAKKYLVYFEYDDGPGGGSGFKVADEVAIESSIKNAYKAAVVELNSREDDVFESPADSPVGSAAHSLLDPNFAEAAIEQHLKTLPYWSNMLLRMNTVFNDLARNGAEISDISQVIKHLRITVRYPDASTEEWEVVITPTVLTDGTLESQLDVINSDDATQQGGIGNVPTSPISFDGFGADNSAGTLFDWVELARHNGIPIDGTVTTCSQDRMVCAVQGEEIRCVVIKGNCE